MPIDGDLNAGRNPPILRDNQLVAMLDEIQTIGAIYQIGRPRLGPSLEGVAISPAVTTFDDPQPVESLWLWQKERLELTLVCSVHRRSRLPFKRVGHFRRADASHGKVMVDQGLS